MDENLPATVLDDFEDKVIILPTDIALKAMRIGSDAFTLYCFYCVTSKQQSISQKKRIVTVKANQTYVMNGLGWGEARLHTAKKLLIDNNLVQNIIKKGKDGKIIGYYIQVNYIPQEPVPTENLLVGGSSTGAGPVQVQPSVNTDTNILNTVNYKNEKKEKTNNRDNEDFPLIVSLVGSSSKQDSENSHYRILPLSELEKWEMATELNVPLWVVKEVDKSFWEYIEEPKNRKKYKTSYKTIRKWIQMGLSRGSYKENNEVEVMLLQSQHPDKIKEIQEMKEYARKEKIVE
uniref:Uncharacterized protein n=1 Tax=viral metagenome TaxID=1070528 RepID=A0A6M3IIH0_9ZZZZ